MIPVIFSKSEIVAVGMLVKSILAAPGAIVLGHGPEGLKPFESADEKIKAAVRTYEEVRKELGDPL